VKGEKMMRQRQDALAAIAERRDSERNHAQAEIQVGAKAPRRYLAAELAVGCSDDSNVHLAGFRRADAKHLAVFEDAEQLGLKVGAGLADLVEE